MSRTILCIADDDERGLRCAALSRAGYVTMLSHSQNAVRKLRQMGFDAVVMNRDLESGTAQQIMAAVPKKTRLLRLELGTAGDHLIAAVDRLF